MRKFSLLTLVALLMLVFSCDKDKNDDAINSDEMGKVLFNFSFYNQLGDLQSSNRLKSVPSFDDARAVVLSIQKANGDATAYSSTKIPLNEMTPDFFDRNLSPGEYKLAECLILDIDDSAIFATPLKGSSQALNVGNPLTLDFSVKKDQQTDFPIDLMPTYGLTPADFGMERFIFNPPIYFFITVKEKGQANEISASLNVSKDTYSSNIDIEAAPINMVSVKGGFADYTLTITKPGFKTYTTNMLADEFKSYERTPLSIELEREFTFGTVTTATGRIWMDRNLGATRVATHKNDEDAYGDLYQWGRAADGHENRNSPITTTLSNTDVPNHAKFIVEVNSGVIIKDWRQPQSDDLWQGVNGINNPCPAGFRLPTKEEWEDEIKTWGYKQDYCDLPLKLPLAANRSIMPFGEAIYFASYWTSTTGKDPNYTGHRSYSFETSPNSAPKLMLIERMKGASVRCIKD